MEGNHFGQVHNKDRMQLREPDLCRICLTEQLVSNSNSSSLEDLMKQLATSNLDNIQFQQNTTATIEDLKMQIEQLADISAGSSNLPSQTIPNSRGNASATPKLAEVDSEAIVDSQSRREIVVSLPFPSRIISARKPESDEELLRMFRKVEINIPLLDAIKQIPKYAKFLKELCVHKRRKMKGSREIRGTVSAVTKSEESTVGTSRVLPKKCRDLGIFLVPCTIGECTFADAMLDLGASINVMPASTIGMTIQLANRSIIQPLGVLEDVLVQVNELMFPTDFYVLDMEDETSGKESTLILGRPFLMTARTKIDVHVGTLSMEFGDTLVQFNIYKAMKHPTKDHSLFSIDIIEELVEEYLQLERCSEDIRDFAGSTNNCLKADHDEVQDFPDSKDNHDDTVDLSFEAALT
ncbi:hypothetical protein CR513_41392, partial [Mucuna pruriens]